MSEEPGRTHSPDLSAPHLCQCDDCQRIYREHLARKAGRGDSPGEWWVGKTDSERHRDYDDPPVGKGDDAPGRSHSPAGWVAMGTHAGPDYCAYTGPLEFSEPHPEDGLPRWERHDGCTAVIEQVVAEQVAKHGPDLCPAEGCPWAACCCPDHSESAPARGK